MVELVSTGHSGNGPWLRTDMNAVILRAVRACLAKPAR
jgi:hypothetical protein